MWTKQHIPCKLIPPGQNTTPVFYSLKHPGITVDMDLSSKNSENKNKEQCEQILYPTSHLS
jgi:hypothetical protein